MSLRTKINQYLIADPKLKQTLATSTIDNQSPAIYEHWAPNDTPMPYVNMSYAEAGSPSNLEKRQGELNVDIFTNNHDTIKAELIARRINILLLNKAYFRSEQDGRIDIYKSPAAGGDIPNEQPEIIHHNLAFELYWWDRELIIAQTENEEE